MPPPDRPVVDALFDSVLTGWRAERTLSPADIEASGGLAVNELQALVGAWGMPPPGPDQPAFTPEEAQVFVELQRLREIWPAEIAMQLARVYGRLLARIAQTEVRLFRTYVERRLREEADALSAGEAVQNAFEGLAPLAEPLLIGLHRRWLEHELAQQAVSDVESTTGDALPGAVDVAFLFCDLKDFTAYADAEGDEAAVAAIDEFARTVSEHRGEHCRFHKALGDGVMLAYDDPAHAVAAGARIVEAHAGDQATPGVHASVHTGVAIVREGDYFGRTVNVAAKLLVVAERDELVATRAAVQRGGHGFDWEPAGAVRVRGVREPVDVWRLVRA